ncbi:histidine phosphatase family protein [Halalkalibacter okhensis]|uniref:Phosphoglycerate mutase n=1 Tax=Halalkalibacter okhensis TaxID=333138 RepID=A0A0B0IMM1_9BACI|nr:histidine phosphatase family protein [Halalkalibacter okhensis]KHF41309.1 phosphoglycerate mutase [Halalkalibacter okhensis]
MNLYLIRHGESEGNVSGLIQGCKDFPLSDLGEQQVELVADYFKDVQLDYLYSSDLTRAYHTAKAIGALQNRTVHKWEKVREVYLGPLQGLTRTEIYETFPVVNETSILTSGIPGTETVQELTERCQHVIDQMLLAHQGDHVGIVSHGGFISIFLMYLLTGEKWYTFHRPFQINNTGITHIEWSKRSNKPLIHYTNKTAHLESLVNQHSKKGLL